MARDTEGGKGTRDGRNPSCGESGGWQLLFDMCRETGAAGTRLERAEEAERAQRQEKDRKEVRQMASENFLKHFLLPRGVGFCCERCHRAQSMSATAHESQGTPDAAGSPRECESEGVCEKHTIWRRAPAGHHYYSPNNTRDQEDEHTCARPRPQCHISVSD
ncbi:hypothetical protein ROHU_017250 [Labeo rohita]|uniref:Uncharacterized protein n=1 Tax=Labeo rohita TaxID=84645 RepID=A0A498LJT2_LABRO|nr:hypothetical protein ROHU_012205 [Labeo rohita]RXN31178.1 hypothetical protein ROHU_017250 [Labeo rohita]